MMNKLPQRAGSMDPILMAIPAAGKRQTVMLSWTVALNFCCYKPCHTHVGHVPQLKAEGMYCVRCCNNSQLQLDPGQMKHVPKYLTGKASMDSLGMRMQDKLKDIQDLDLHQAARALAS